MKIGTILAFVFSLLVQVAYPLAVTLRFRRKTGASWELFVYGAMIFAVFQLFTWLPLSVYLDAAIGARLTSEMAAFLWLLALAFSTSLVEELGRWLGFRYLFPGGPFKLTWRNGVMYALGHGSVETMLLIAGLTFIYFLAYVLLGRTDLSTLLGTLATAPSLESQATIQAILETSWPQPLYVALERVLALPHQVAWALLVMQSLVSRQKRWFGLAVLYHWSIAVIVPGLARLLNFPVAEGVNILLAILSLWIITKLRAVSSDVYDTAPAR